MIYMKSGIVLGVQTTTCALPFTFYSSFMIIFQGHSTTFEPVNFKCSLSKIVQVVRGNHGNFWCYFSECGMNTDLEQGAEGGIWTEEEEM
jgi:hypothetical protein